MKIGKFSLPTHLILPAIAGFSDVGLRMLCLRYGASLTFTEMVSAKGLLYGNENTAALLTTHPSEKIKAVQLFGGEPEIIASAIQTKELEKFDIIDINFGCPVPKIVKNQEGSALMRMPYLVHNIIKAAVAAADGRAVTAKIRAGFSPEEKNAPEVAKACEEGGAAMVTIHGRTRDMFYSGVSDLEIIRKVKDAVKIPVVGNGDVVDRNSYLRMLEYTGVDGVAIARGAIGKPYVFAEVRGVEADYNIAKLISEHTRELLKTMPEFAAVNNMKKHIAAYVRGLVGAKKIRTDIYNAESLADIDRIVREI
ncbi:MAG: tRNA-dihydrouridine synthase [Clostridia bacterium]